MPLTLSFAEISPTVTRMVTISPKAVFVMRINPLPPEVFLDWLATHVVYLIDVICNCSRSFLTLV